MSSLKFTLPPTRTPNASQWNIGCVGAPGIGAGTGHTHFMLFVSISFALGGQRKRGFQWNMGSRDFRDFREDSMALSYTKQWVNL